MRFWNNFHLVLSVKIFKMKNKFKLCKGIEDYLYLLFPLNVCVKEGGGGGGGSELIPIFELF